MKGKNGILLFVEFLKGLLEDRKIRELLRDYKKEVKITNEKEERLMKRLFKHWKDPLCCR